MNQRNLNLNNLYLVKLCGQVQIFKLSLQMGNLVSPRHRRREYHALCM